MGQPLRVAAPDPTTAERVLPDELDRVFKIVYDALLRAVRALMRHTGFRPRGAGQHWTIVQFCGQALGREYKRQVTLFEQMRRKRYRRVYEMVGLVSRQEAEQVLTFASSLVEEIRLRLTGQPLLELEERES